MNPLVEKAILGLLLPAIISAASVVGGWSYLKDDVKKQEVRLQIIETARVTAAESDGRIKAILEQLQRDVAEIKLLVREEQKHK